MAVVLSDKALNLTLVFLSICPFLASQESSSSVPTTSESILRRWATKTVRPSYPQAAITKRTEGVVVVNVRVAPSGRVSGVHVLEAPSIAIAQSTIDAVSKWEFQQAPLNQTAIGFTAKLTFYFVLKGGSPLVQSPSEATYLGDWYWGQNPITMK
jgi:TonB family protein